MQGSQTKKTRPSGSKRKKSSIKKVSTSKKKAKTFPSIILNQFKGKVAFVARHPLAKSAIKWVQTSPLSVSSIQSLARTKANLILSKFRK